MRSAERLWALNDGGDAPVLYALSPGGQVQARLHLNGTRNVDWEALDAAEINGEATLLIADIGDNAAKRENLTIYLATEPESVSNAAAIDVRQTLRVVIEDGARDFEGAAWDPIDQRIMLLSKRDAPPRLYSLELPDAPATGAAMVTARFAGVVTRIPADTADDRRADPRWGHLRDQPTALSISADGRLIVVTTYKDSYAWQRASQQSVADALDATPLTIDTPQFRQTEAATITADGRSLLVLSEQLPALMARVALP